MVSWQLKHGHLLCSNFCLANLHTGEGKDTMEDSFESYFRSKARQLAEKNSNCIILFFLRKRIPEWWLLFADSLKTREYRRVKNPCVSSLDGHITAKEGIPKYQE